MTTMTSRLFSALLGLALLAGCAAADTQKVSQSASQTALTPLSDLNLVNAPIPEALRQAQQSPYRSAREVPCPAVADEIRALDAVLGADLDTPPTESNPGLIERGGAALGGAAQRAVEGAMPFRGWVRKLSGAERYSQQVAAAIAAGTVRRAYLKGIAQARGC